MPANPILMYHHIGTAPPDAGSHACLWVTAEAFDRQLATLRALGYRSAGPAEFEAGLANPARERTVWITFDDGFANNHAAALPVLKRHGMTATFYLVADWTLGGDPRCMTPGQVRELLAEGMTIGAHTCSHPRLSKLPPGGARAEVLESGRRLEDAFGVPVTTFCFPYGNACREALDAVREGGYRLALSTRRGNRNGPADRWLLKRIMMTSDRQGARLRYSFSGLYDWLHARKNRRRWADIESHGLT